MRALRRRQYFHTFDFYFVLQLAATEITTNHVITFIVMFTLTIILIIYSSCIIYIIYSTMYQSSRNSKRERIQTLRLYCRQQIKTFCLKKYLNLHPCLDHLHLPRCTDHRGTAAAVHIWKVKRMKNYIVANKNTLSQKYLNLHPFSDHLHLPLCSDHRGTECIFG